MQELIRQLYFVLTHWQMQWQIKSFLTITFNPHIWWPTVPAWLSGREHFSGWWGWSATLSPGWGAGQMDSGFSEGEKGCKAKCFSEREKGCKRKRLQGKMCSFSETQVGVVSWGLGCGSTVPGVYADVQRWSKRGFCCCWNIELYFHFPCHRSGSVPGLSRK